MNHLLELLEDGGMILIQRSSPHPISYSDQPKSTRDKVVAELLETERKYVHDLEKLQVIQQGLPMVWWWEIVWHHLSSFPPPQEEETRVLISINR